MKSLLTLLLLLVPTGLFAQSHPVFLSRPADMARYAAMKANYDANPTAPTSWGGKFYKRIKDNAECNCRYSDMGQWAAFMYHVTEDPIYINHAWISLQGFLTATASAISGNYLREHGYSHVLNYDWLYPGLSAEQRTAYLNQINVMINRAGAIGGTDSDQTTGEYFTAAMLMYSTGSYNSTIATIWNTGTTAVNTHPFGGYTFTSADKTTSRRNAVHWYTTIVGNGGVWPESTEYNLNTAKQACLAAEILRAAQAPTDNYADIGTYCEDLAKVLIHEVTPGININSKVYIFAETQNQDSLMSGYRKEITLGLAGINMGKSIGPIIQDFALDYFEGNPSTDIWHRGFWFFDDSAPRGDHTTLALTHWAPGKGIVFTRTGHTTADTMAVMHMPGLTGEIHHALYHFGEFQIWRNGRWALTHPLGYGGISHDTRGTNSVSMRGFATASPRIVEIKEYKAGEVNGVQGALQYPHKLVQRTDNTNGFIYLAGTEGGSFSFNGAYGITPVIIHEYSRSFVWLQNQQAMVVFDRSNVKSDAEGTCIVRADVKAYSDAQPRSVLRYHMPLIPTIESGYTTWNYGPAGGAIQNIKVSNLLPTNATISVVADNVDFGTSGTTPSPDGVRRGYHVNVVAPDQRFNTYLHVFDPYDVGSPSTVSLVRDTNNLVDGTLVTKGTTSHLVVFNAIQGPDVPDMAGVSCPNGGGAGTYTGLADEVLDIVRYRGAGYTLSFTGPVGGTKALLFDLDPNTDWDYKINGGTAQALTVDANGTGVIDIANTGAVTLEVISAGVLPVSVQTGSLPAGKVSTAYSQTLSAIGGIGAPYTWTKTVGSFPAGLSLTGDTIGGTPTTAGTETFTVQACDGDSSCGTRQLSITIADIPSISTTGLSGGTVGVAYSQAISATGGATPLVFTISSGTLCAGLSLSTAGLISGTPTTVEGCTFTVLVTDDNALTDTADFGITIVSNLLPITVSAAPGSTSVVITHSTPALDYSDSCTVNLLDGEAILDTSTTLTGGATRIVNFSNLFASQTYGIDVLCGTATAPRTYFQTLSAPELPPGETINWTYSLKPHVRLVNRGVTKARVAYRTVLYQSFGEYVTVTADCVSGCTVVLPLVPNTLYQIYHTWLNAADEVMATSKLSMVAVQ